MGPLWYTMVLTIMLWESIRRIGLVFFIRPFRAKRAARKRGVNPNAPKQSGETYGHPLPPVKTLYDALPPPPPGHAWEIVVVPVELWRFAANDGHDHEAKVITPSLSLECRLINLGAPEASRVVSSRAVDLIWRDWYHHVEGNTWVSWWRGKTKGVSMQSQVVTHLMRTELLRFILDWAQAQVDCIRIETIANGGGEYMMKGS